MSDNWVVALLQKALDRWNSTLEEVWKIATLSPEEFLGGGVWEKVEVIHQGILAIAYGLLVLFFVMGVVKTCSSFAEMKRPEQVIKMFIRFALSKAAVENALELMLKLTEIIQGIVSAVMTSASAALPENATLPEEVVTAIEEADFLSSIPLWAVALLTCVAVWILSFLLILSVYGRFFRIFMYTAIAPIPLSAFAGEGTSRMGLSFLKSYLAVCLEGVIVVIACIIFSLFASETPTLGGESSAIALTWEYMGQLIFHMLILVGCVRMADRTVHEMIGI